MAKGEKIFVRPMTMQERISKLERDLATVMEKIERKEE